MNETKEILKEKSIILKFRHTTDLFSKKRKYIIVFLLQQQEGYSIIRTKRVNPSNITVSYRDKSFPINLTLPTYSKLLKTYYFVDINKGQLFFQTSKQNSLNAEVIDLVMAKHIVKDLSMNLTDTTFKMNLLIVVTGLIIGGLTGFIVGYMI